MYYVYYKMNVLVAIFGTMYVANYIEENIIDPVSNKINEWKQNIENSIDEYNNKKQQNKTNEIIKEHKETRNRIKEKYNIK